MSKTKLKKYLLSLTKEQVVDIMLELYAASKEANVWLEFYMEQTVKRNSKNSFEITTGKNRIGSLWHHLVQRGEHLWQLNK